MKEKTKFVCGECGYETVKWMGCCPMCGSWNTLVEVSAAPEKRSTHSAGGTSSRAVTLGSVSENDTVRVTTGIGEFDRVLGGQSCGLLCGGRDAPALRGSHPVHQSQHKLLAVPPLCLRQTAVQLMEAEPMLTVKPMSLADANRFVAEHHRHHKPVRGHKFSLGCMANGHLAGVAIVGRPVSRYLDDGLTLEVNRLCTDGTKNACSFLYGAAARAAKVLGYHRIVTYILDTESGVSLRASGWRCAGLAGGRQAPPVRTAVSGADEIPI